MTLNEEQVQELARNLTRLLTLTVRTVDEIYAKDHSISTNERCRVITLALGEALEALSMLTEPQ